MLYKNAVFNPDWLDKEDPRCRDLAKDHWWNHSQLVITDNPNKFDIDTFVSRLYCAPHAALELEYTADKWRFSNGVYRSRYHEVSVPMRKEKWFEWYKNTYWMGFSYDFNHYILIPGKVILHYDIRRKYHVYNNTEKETFLMVPQYDPHTNPQPILHGVLKKHNIPIV